MRLKLDSLKLCLNQLFGIPSNDIYWKHPIHRTLLNTILNFLSKIQYTSICNQDHLKNNNNKKIKRCAKNFYPHNKFYLLYISTGLPKWSTLRQSVSSMAISFWSVSQTERSEMFCLQYRFGLGDMVTPPKILVSNGTSPLWVKLNFPATGHLTGTGFLAVVRNFFISKSEFFFWINWYEATYLKRDHSSTLLYF